VSSVIAERSGVRVRAITGRFLADAAHESYRIVAVGGSAVAAPAISVIVPTRNRRDLVRETIEALFAQDLPADAFEIIVVDNASSDETESLMRACARDARVRFIGAVMGRDRGPAISRNVGVMLARGELIAFTDSDCVPAAGWLRGCIEAMAGTDVGVVQGMTTAVPHQAQPLFNHFIETKRLDGSFSTSNVCYRRDALAGAGGFDPSCVYWEDVDLGWRVKRLGWEARFEPDALVHHQVLRLSAWQWLTHPRHFYNWPAKAARYPGFRRHLFAGLWVDWSHALFDGFVLGLALARWRRAALLLTLPYIVAFGARRRLRGRWPLLKLAAHFAYDCVGCGALVAGSIRYRRPVL
jgi:glycosyltransferase involved in cell wall biosynthesis